MGPGLNYKYYIIFFRTLDTAPFFSYITICRTKKKTSDLFTSYHRFRGPAQCPCLQLPSWGARVYSVFCPPAHSTLVNCHLARLDHHALYTTSHHSTASLFFVHFRTLRLDA